VAVFRPAMLMLLCLRASCDRGGSSKYVPTFDEGPHAASAMPEYVFTIHPLHNPMRLSEIYQPMIDAINQRAAGFSVKLEPFRDYPSYDAKLQRREPQIAMVNPYQAILFEGHGYRILVSCVPSSLAAFHNRSASCWTCSAAKTWRSWRVSHTS
jgi:phosphonate transport system substrate-binding protein